MSRYVYLTDNFIDDLQKNQNIIGFKAFIVNTKFKGNLDGTVTYEMFKSLLDSIRSNDITDILNCDFVNFNSMNEQLLIKLVVDKALEEDETAVVFGYQVQSKDTPLTVTNTGISLESTYYYNYKIGFLFTWVNDIGGDTLITMHMSENTSNIFIDLSKYRILARLVSVSKTSENVDHQHGTVSRMARKNDKAYNELAVSINSIYQREDTSSNYYIDDYTQLGLSAVALFQDYFGRTDTNFQTPTNFPVYEDINLHKFLSIQDDIIL